jgi:hypothetical protein
VPGFLVLRFRVTLMLMLVLGFLAVLTFLVLLTSGGGGSRLTPSGIAGTRLDTARRARWHCRWLMAATG